jgi:uncharacterized protein (TIGR02600 family)
LVIVLAFLVLITVLILAFFTSVTTETGSVRLQSDTLNARQLADSTTQYLISQMRLGTSVGTEATWASQPGLIRTFGADGQPRQVFKLYSANEMVSTVSPGGYDPGVDLPGPNWAREEATWTDLNTPVFTSSGRLCFPILDPRAAALPDGKTAPQVEGFSYDATKMAGAKAPSGTEDTTARAPMPVRWLYMLKDGQWTSPSSAFDAALDFSNSNPKPTEANPIVARTAFWTDDETCKLNLNTAAGGVFWDMPTYTSGIETHFSRYKPVKDEFARYPGHPATTSLAPVLWSFGGLTSPDFNLFPTLNPPWNPGYRYRAPAYAQIWVAASDATPFLSAAARAYFQKIQQLSPRNMWGGSEMGTKSTVSSTNEPAPSQALDGDRLYASVDEALFGMPTTPDSPRPANPFALTDADLEKLRFFLTTQSRSPDLNPFNQPRVGMWPIDLSLAKRTPTDQLIAFCSTLKSSDFYFFTRSNRSRATTDFQPGSRNDQVFDYLDRSLSLPVPGFGGNFKSRYGTEGNRRLLTLMYDYIRGGVNLTETYGATDPASARHAFVPALSGATSGQGQVIPIRVTKAGRDYNGLGRFVAIKQVALQFMAVAANQPPCLIDASGVPTSTPNPLHPWVNIMPASVAVSDNLDGTWNLSPGGTAYPTLNTTPGPNPPPTFQTHAGLPLITTKWISDPSIYTATAPAKVALRNAILNTRYQGPASLYGSGGGVGATNSQLLPQPAPVATSGQLGPHATQIQAYLLLDPIVTLPGCPPYSGDYQIRVRGLEAFKANGRSLGFPADAIHVHNRYTRAHMSSTPGYYAASNWYRGSSNANAAGFRLKFVSQPVIVERGAVDGKTFEFEGGSLTVEIRAMPTSGDPTLPSNLGELIQTLNVPFPSSVFPTPLLPPMPMLMNANGTHLMANIAPPPPTPPSAPPPPPPPSQFYELSVGYRSSGIPGAPQDLAPSTILTCDIDSALARNPNFGVGSLPFYRVGKIRTHYGSGFGGDLGYHNFILPERFTVPDADFRAKLTADTVRAVELRYGDARVAASLPVVGSGFFTPHRFYHDPTLRSAHTLRAGYGNGEGTNILGATDHMLSDAAALNPSAGFTYTRKHVAGQRDNYRGVPAAAPPEIRALGAYSTRVTGVIRSNFPHVTSSVDFNDAAFQRLWGAGGDFDTGAGLSLDGGFICKSNEGGQMLSTQPHDARNTNPEFCQETYEFNFASLISAPNRQVPSSVVFGSLPVGNTPETSWRTLLFCPNPNSPTHVALSEAAPAGQPPLPGKAPDWLLLDFFQMPVVEPYAIGEPFSTAGRVNLNYQIAPFTYLRRDTALRGVLRSGMVTAVEDSRVTNSKEKADGWGFYDDGASGPYTTFLRNSGHWAFRYPVHPGETLKQFESRFAGGDIFRAPSEICSLWLYPAKQPTATQPENSATPLVTWDADNSNIKGWWYDNPGGSRKSVTGDNVRERAYATLYPRLTTKSNTFTAYFKVQVLQKSRGSDPTKWTEGRDQVRSEYRGSATVERYIDPSDPSLPDFAQASSATIALDDFYRYRVLNTKRFAP